MSAKIREILSADFVSGWKSLNASQAVYRSTGNQPLENGCAESEGTIPAPKSTILPRQAPALGGGGEHATSACTS